MFNSSNLSHTPSPSLLPSPNEIASWNLVFWQLLLFLPNFHILEISIAVSVYIAIQSLKQKRYQGLPVWPVLGMMPSLIAAHRTNMYEWITDVLIRQNGTFTFKGPWFSRLNCVVTSDPRNVEHILKTKFSIYPKGPFFRETVRDLLGDGIFNADDESWQHQRKTASTEFHSAKFRRLTIESIHDLVHSRLLPVLQEHFVKHLVPIDLQDVLLRLTFDNVCMIAFGVDSGCLNSNLPEIPFAKAFEDATELTVLRFITPSFLWKFMRHFNLGPEKKLKIALKGVNEFAENVIQTRKKEQMDKIQRSDLLSVFMGLRDENGNPFSEEFLRDICVNFILAGRDTSSVALSWFFWLIDENPEVEERILEEICGIVEKREEKKKELANGVAFEAEEIKKMEYLQAALSEALRLYPSVPVDHKEVAEDDVFPDGTALKKGTRVIYAIYAMGRTDAVWGPDCRQFKPDRWLKDGRFTGESAYRFAAFNGGPRLCLGKEFAYYQMKYTAATILTRYHVKVVETRAVVPKLAFTLYMKHGLLVNLVRREEAEFRKYFKLNI